MIVQNMLRVLGFQKCKFVSPIPISVFVSKSISGHYGSCMFFVTTLSIISCLSSLLDLRSLLVSSCSFFFEPVILQYLRWHSFSSQELSLLSSYVLIPNLFFIVTPNIYHPSYLASFSNMHFMQYLVYTLHAIFRLVLYFLIFLNLTFF